VAAAVYVAVEDGVTLADPVAPNVPTPAMLTEVALVEVQLRTDDAPATMVLGCALSVTAGGGPVVVTLTTIEDTVVPAEPMAVAV